jgi:hypothetical protein
VDETLVIRRQNQSMNAVLATGRYPAPTRKKERKNERGRECSDVVVVVVAVPSSSSSPELRALGAILVAFLEKLFFVRRCFGFLVSVSLEAVFAAVESFFLFYVSSHYQCLSPCLRFICFFQHRFLFMSCRKFLFPGGPVSVSWLLLGSLFCLSLNRLFVRKKEISFVIF